jgi:putative transcriptional regulator
MPDAGSRILRSARQALAIARGEADPATYAVHVPEQVDVKRIREKLDMTQERFAATFGFSVASVRHWERRDRTPEGPARAYLLVIDRDPDAVRRALAGKGQEA